MNFDQSQALFRRAAAVIPGGIYGHTTPAATVPGAVPYFAAEGFGCRYRDVDGNVFIDFMGGYGPLVLGYHHPEVEAAAHAARQLGAAFNHPTPLLVELAEKLTQRIDFADWAVFAKNGADLTNWSIMVAREVTGRPKILKIRGAYHGTAAWCTPGHGGLIPSDRVDIADFPFNDITALEALFAQHRGQVAGLILTPFHHPAFADSVLPTPEFVAACNRLCREHGALQILDDVRCGFRLTADGSHSLYGYKPDLAIYCKALANGHPISACVGRASHKAAASRVFLTGSYWSDPAPMAAALATLDIIAREQIPQRLALLGQRFVDGFLALGKKHGVDLIASGPPAMPYLRVKDDPSFMRTQALCTAIVAQGVFIHPHHNWFISAAMTEADIDEALRRIGIAFDSLPTTPHFAS
ncbi:aminotransferase class III-fold pyridoxal phosphate-dependent enzyme [Rariglobus hedericola]|uniref:Aminotransferase class III-fold pyridoxal phosphate-dependent enzyme n=1 Tax=Rariglobus hedericola TaxID=2597822 RepID=A0A556QJ77_9BACT|nr:aminotransferase class III-fold pyridoxal phosphate-dependent enzyme [Rariglobus hedericola]TSJ76679.1 aminotransferase class III-fold pyridoxal phosphate-dependent enzyme [Rariglobus hedericola]